MVYMFSDNGNDYKIDVPDEYITLSRRNLGWNNRQASLVYAVDTLHMEFSEELMNIVEQAKTVNAKTDEVLHEAKPKGMTGAMLAPEILSLVLDSWNNVERVHMQDSKGKTLYCFSMGDDVYEIKVCKKRKKVK